MSPARLPKHFEVGAIPVPISVRVRVRVRVRFLRIQISTKEGSSFIFKNYHPSLRIVCNLHRFLPEHKKSLTMVNPTEPTQFTRKDSYNIVQGFTSMLFT